MSHGQHQHQQPRHARLQESDVYRSVRKWDQVKVFQITRSHSSKDVVKEGRKEEWRGVFRQLVQ